MLPQFPVPFFIVPMGSSVESVVLYGNVAPAIVLTAWLLGAAIIGVLLGYSAVNSVAERFRRRNLRPVADMHDYVSWRPADADV